MDLFERLRSSATGDWTSYVEHEFVHQLGAGTLPQAAFRIYLVQDFLFLIQLARAYALAAYKSRTLVDIRAAQTGLAAILDETALHVRLCARWGLDPDALAATPELPPTVAYTRFVLDCGAAGDLLDLHIALAPCVVGYAEIGRALAPSGTEALGTHPYRDWIAEYASEAYQAVAEKARLQLNRLAARALTEQRFPELAATFATASRLEADFWQMALDTATPQL